MGAMMSWLVFPDPYLICLCGFMKVLVPVLVLFGGLFGYVVNMIGVSESMKVYYSLKLTAFSSFMWFMPFLPTLKVSKWELLSY